MTQIAGLEVGRPTSIEEVTPEWLTEVFRISGSLGPSGSVVSVSAEPFAVGVGFLSDLAKVTVEYEGDAEGAPETVIVKMATGLEVQRGIADALSFYSRELRFYREVAPAIEVRTPKVHAAMMSEENSDFVLVMEDLSGLRGMDQATGVTPPDAHLAVAGLARIHSHYWDQDLSDLQTTFLPFNNPVYAAALPQIFDSGWDRAKQEAADLMDEAVIAYGDRFRSLVPFFLETFDASPSTLVHGDWRADNIMVDDNGDMVALDFQIVGTGAGVYDLGYFMSQSVEPEVRRDHADSIVDTYYAALDEAGVKYDRGAMNDTYRLAMAWCLLYPVSMFAGWENLPETNQAMARAMLRRSVTAIVDNNSLDLVPE